MNKITDYGLQRNKKPLPVVYFRIHTAQYVIDYSTFQQLRLVVKLDISSRTTVVNLNQSNIVEINGEKLIEWVVPDSLLASGDKLIVTPRVTLSGSNKSLTQFKLITYDMLDSNMNAVLNTILKFNEMYSQYLYSVKQTEKGQVNGVVPLGSEGKFDIKYLQLDVGEHVNYKLYDTLYTIPNIHGLRLDRLSYQLMYYKEDEQQWYEVNQIHGGFFGYDNVESLSPVFGGNFTDTQTYYSDVFGGNF